LRALGKEGPLRVLDPMAGSGTVLAVARAEGHRAFGIDIDPLAVLLAGVWTRTVNPTRSSDKAAEVLDRAQRAFRDLPVGRAYPLQSDRETQAFIRFWFDDYARRQLAALSGAIRRVRDEDTRDVLWCGFSRLIITKSAGASLAMDLSHSRPHREFERAPVKPFGKFLSAVKTVISNCPQHDGTPVGPPACVQRGDARQLNIAAASIDLVLTSPPYLNAIDYMRCSKFSLVWMGYRVADLRTIRSDSVGSEAASGQASMSVWVRTILKHLKLSPAPSVRDRALLAQYIWDMGRAIAEVSRVLRSGGRAVYVVGDSTVRSTFMENSAVVTAVAERSGLTLKSKESRDLPANRRYLPPPGAANAPGTIDGRMRRESVLVFEKVAS